MLLYAGKPLWYLLLVLLTLALLITIFYGLNNHNYVMLGLEGMGSKIGGNNMPLISVNVPSTLNISENVGKLGNQQGSPDNLSNVGSSTGSNFNQYISVKCNNKLTPQNQAFNYWVAGFFEGEGTFNVSFKLNPELRTGIDIGLMVGVSQHIEGKIVLERIKALFGGIGSAIYPKAKGSDVMVYSITNLKDLLTVVIPFLEQYNKYSARKPALNMLVEVCRTMARKEHLSISGMTKIINLVFDTPLKKSNRQFSKQELLYVLGDQAKVTALITQRRR